MQLLGAGLFFFSRPDFLCVGLYALPVWGTAKEIF